MASSLLLFAMGFCFPKNDSRSTLGIPQSSADLPFLSKTFNAIAKKATQKQKGETAEAEALKARHKENRYEILDLWFGA